MKNNPNNSNLSEDIIQPSSSNSSQKEDDSDEEHSISESGEDEQSELNKLMDEYD